MKNKIIRNFRTMQFLTVTLLALSACVSSEDKEAIKLEADLLTYFELNYIDSTSSVDSFYLIKVDTINERMVLYRQAKVLKVGIDKLIYLHKNTSTLFDNEIDLSRINMRLRRLKVSKGHIKMAELYNSRIFELKMEMIKVDSIRESLYAKAVIADTLSPVGFQARCFYQERLKDRSVKRDSTNIFLNLNKDIIESSVLAPAIYQIDFTKFY